MKTPKFLMLSILLLGFTFRSPAQTITPEEEILFQLGLSLMLTENYAEAEDCFKKLANINDPVLMTAVNTNHGVNQMMWGLSKLKKSEAEELIKYVFPFEVAPDLSKKGNNIEEEQRKAEITQLFKSAVKKFKACVQSAPNSAGPYLNLASAQAILSRWLDDPHLLKKSSRTIDIALGKAGTSPSRGYCLIIKGIIYDYLGNMAQRDDLFDQAQSLYEAVPDERLLSLIQRNQAVRKGTPAVFVSTDGQKWDVFSDNPERIDDVSLLDLMHNPNLEIDATITDFINAKLYQKNYPQSGLYIYFQSENHFFFFHQTGKDYSGKTGKEIGIGDNEAYVTSAYGRPVRVQPALGGKFLYYQKAKLIFFIGNDGSVESWMVWIGKKQ